MKRRSSSLLGAPAGSLLLAAALASMSGCQSPAAARGAAAPSAARPAATGTLAQELAEVFGGAEREAGGHLGAALLHIESGERASYHGGERFPLQSVFKLPLAIEVLARVDAGEIKLDEVIHIRPIDIRPGPAKALAAELPAAGGDRTVLDLLERVVISSDNTAADALLARLGGPRKVTERLLKLGVEGIDVSRSEAELMMDFTGVTTPPPRDAWTLARLREITDTKPADRARGIAAYLDDPRDTATPEAMANLLLRVHRRDLLAGPSAARLVEILERVETGKDRLKGLLPQGTVVAHKTGTSDVTDGVTGTTNDAGIITLPGSAGHLVVVAFLRASRGDDAAQARAIARIARAAFDHYAPR